MTTTTQDDDRFTCTGCGKPIEASEPSTTLDDEQYHDACAHAELNRRSK